MPDMDQSEFDKFKSAFEKGGYDPNRFGSGSDQEKKKKKASDYLVNDTSKASTVLNVNGNSSGGSN